MLNLLRSCLSKSENVTKLFLFFNLYKIFHILKITIKMRGLALSMDFDMSRYQISINESEFADKNNNENKTESSAESKDEFDSIVKNIDTLIHSDQHGEIDIK